ncbi:MAG TPA: MFS transporter [Solirubrobacteraceae bacterium]|jgi:EmrB/QacA subfamily drug resistance transporter|nr:MFS transporter [Solirubrobacteraceae bacterium]
MERKWWTLIAVCVATFMLLLDITVVNTALPSIRKDLHSSFTDLQWVVDAYALTLAAFVLTSGSLADRLGRKRVFVIGLGIFTLASLFCGLAGSPTVLNLSRALQGVGGAVMFAVSLALLAQEWRGAERATATAIYGATIGVAVALGPLVGGALTQAIGWQSIFFLNIPVGVAAIVVTVLTVAESRDETARGIDWGGTFTFSTANALLVLALLRGNDDGWTSAVILALLATSILLFVAFVAIELRVTQPMLPLTLFRSHAFTGAQITAFALSGSMFALFLYITLYMQEIEHLSPLQAGLRYLPFTVGSFFVAGGTASLEGKVPARALLSGGLAITALGLVLMSGAKANDAWTVLLPGFIVGGLGVGLVNPVLANVALSTVPERMSGVASGINDTFRQVAIASGTAGLGALFLALSQQRIQDLLPHVSGDRARGLAEAVSSGTLPAGAPAPVVHAAREGFTHGFSVILLVGAALSLMGAVLALLLVRDSDLRHDEASDVAAEPVTA